MRIVQISDVHFTHSCFNPLRLCSKRFLGLVNWLLFRKPTFESKSLKELPDLWKSLSVDMVLVGGDLTTTALPSEFEEARQYFNRCSQPTLFIPGNHDHYTRGAYRKRRFYNEFTNRGALEGFSLTKEGVEVHRMASGWWCIALDTARPTSLLSSNGYFTPKVEQYLLAALSLIPKSDRVLLLNHFPFFQNDFPHHRMIRGERLREILENHPNIFLYLHGHTHRHTIADLQSSSLPLVLDSGCPVQKHRGSWNLIDLTNSGCTVQPYRWNEDRWSKGEKQEIQWTRL